MDTNLWISYLLQPDSPLADTLDTISTDHTLLYSYDTLKELAEMLTRPKFARYIDEEDVRAFMNELTAIGEEITVDIEVQASRDPKDNKFIALAVCGQAACVITGDADLLSLGTYKDIPILRITDFDALASRHRG